MLAFDEKQAAGTEWPDQALSRLVQMGNGCMDGVAPYYGNAVGASSSA